VLLAFCRSLDTTGFSQLPVTAWEDKFLSYSSSIQTFSSIMDHFIAFLQENIHNLNRTQAFLWKEDWSENLFFAGNVKLLMI
jgi:hypothetical protein